MKQTLIKAWKYYEAKGFKLAPVALEINAKGKKVSKKGCAFPRWKQRTYSVYDLKDGHNTLAVITGEPSDLFVIDIDINEKANGLDYLKKHNVSFPEDTPRAQTQSDGLHLFFRYPKHLENIISTTRAKPKFGIDIRGADGLIFLPPSQVDGGGAYKWIKPPNKSNLKPLPKDLEELLIKTFSIPKSETKGEKDAAEPDEKPACKKVKKPTKKQQLVWDKAVQAHQSGYASGNRSDKDYALAITGLKFYIPEDSIIAALKELSNAKSRDKGQGQQYIRRTLAKARLEIKSNVSSDGKPPIVDQTKRDTYPFTDYGNAKRMVDWFGKELLYCDTLSQWYFWDGKRYQIDRERKRVHYAKKTMLAIENPVWQIKSQSRTRLESMVSLARDEKAIITHSDDLNGNIMLLNVQNGTVDLTTGKLYPHTRSHKITKLANTYYDPKATCPRFMSFLDQIQNKNEEMIHFIQRAIGYGISGSTQEQCLFYLKGQGSNGKSTLLDIISWILNDYSQQADPSLLIANKYETHPTGLADLYGARFVVTSEPDKNRNFDESRIKMLTGEKRLKARFMRQDNFEFNTTHTFFLMANNYQRTSSVEEAFWRRFIMVPFPVSIPDHLKDRKLSEKFIHEAPGILAWAVRGCLLWQKEGLKPPSASRAMKEEYQDDMNILSEFFKTCCIVHKKAKCTTKALYEAYTDFCEKNSDNPIKKRTFGIALREHGYQSWRSGTSRGWIGLRLIENNEPLFSE